MFSLLLNASSFEIWHVSTCIPKLSIMTKLWQMFAMYQMTIISQILAVWMHNVYIHVWGTDLSVLPQLLSALFFACFVFPLNPLCASICAWLYCSECNKVNALKYKLKVLVMYLSISLYFNFYYYTLRHCINRGKYCPFTPLHYLLFRLQFENHVSPSWLILNSNFSDKN